MRARHGVLGASLLLALVVAAACSGGGSATKPIGEGCVVASDCTDPFVCAFQRCHSQCATSRDCPDGTKCVASQFPKIGICLLQTESTCERNSDCASPLVCGRSGRCEKQCGSERDCLAGQSCIAGSCVDAIDAVDGGPPGEVGQTCLRASDCSEPLACKLGVCTVECVNVSDCAPDQACVNSRCRSTTAASVDGGPDAPAGFGAPCAVTSDCSGALVCKPNGTCGYECRADSDCGEGHYCGALNRCLVGTAPFDGGPTDSIAPPGDGGKACALDFDCDDGVFCNGTERCLVGRCYAPASVACDPHSSCYKANCDEASRKCLAPTRLGAGTDLDGDGHLDVACGGDDCDDRDRTVYKGATELCDGKDNDCNALVDDHSVLPRGADVSSSAATRPINSGRGALLDDKLANFYLTGAPGVGCVTLRGATVDATGAVSTSEKDFGVGALCTPYEQPQGIVHAQGGSGTALVLWERPDSRPAGAPPNAGPRLATIVKSDLSVAATVTLIPSQYLNPWSADAQWFGGQYLLAWTRPPDSASLGSSVQASFGFLKTDGTLDARVLATRAGGSDFGPATDVRIGAFGSYIAVAAMNVATHTEVTIFSSTGGLLAGPIDPYPGDGGNNYGNPIAVAGNSAGFVILVNNPSTGITHASFVSFTGVVGKYVELPTHAISGTGGTDGKGAMFVVQASDGAHFLYVHGNLDDGYPVEDTRAFSPTEVKPNDSVGMDTVGATSEISYYSDKDQRTHFVKIGCATPPP